MVMGDNPSHFKGNTVPVEQVPWNDAQAFIQKLNEMEGHKRYRLPTEVEWEYAARPAASVLRRLPGQESRPDASAEP